MCFLVSPKGESVFLVPYEYQESPEKKKPSPPVPGVRRNPTPPWCFDPLEPKANQWFFFGGSMCKTCLFLQQTRCRSRGIELMQVMGRPWVFNPSKAGFFFRPKEALMLCF